MNCYIKYAVLLTSLLSFSFVVNHNEKNGARKFPFREQGLNEREAAAHLLNRFGYGPRPGEIDAVVATGLENWFETQLDASASDAELEKRLQNFDALKLSNAEIANIYVKNGQVARMAIADGSINKDSVNKENKKAYRESVKEYMDAKGLKPERELIRQFVSQKFIRSIYSQNQLQEMMTDFWFNHFNVSFTKGNCVQFIPSYERDVIRVNALGNFEKLLVASAKSPAMLLYLDNFISSAENTKAAKKPNRKMKGLNENYAREVMELHTLGVDGGYTQHDVTEAARVLTGWTIYPIGKNGYGSGVKQLLEKHGEQNLKSRGFVHDGDFLFVPNRHDADEKTVLGIRFARDGGYEEGLKLLHMLATHTSTAKFISRKIAIRFVSDDPSEVLVEKMAAAFTKNNGDVREVLKTMVQSDEFWKRESVRSKTKSPFELAVSAARALNADVRQPFQLFNWVNRMGQRVYFYQAPTGFPDRAQYWINTGALLNRMNFGLAFADARIPGVKFNLLALNENHEPESGEQALLAYSKLLMPERPLEKTLERVTPLLNGPELQRKIDEAAGDSKMNMNKLDSLSDEPETLSQKDIPEGSEGYRLSQVVGILIGSPEFQRR